MAYHLIDGSAHAFWETFKIQRGGDGVVPGGLFVDPAVDLLRGDPFPDPSGHIVQDRHVHFGALPDGRDLCGLLDHTAGGDNVALIAVPGQFLVKIIVTFFILDSAAAPAGIIAVEKMHGNQLLI